MSIETPWHPQMSNRYQHKLALQWRHNDHDGVSNHQPHGCLLNRLFRRRSKKTSKLRVTSLCVGIGEFPTQRISYVENVSIWWHHHGYNRVPLWHAQFNAILHRVQYGLKWNIRVSFISISRKMGGVKMRVNHMRSPVSGPLTYMWASGVLIFTLFLLIFKY